MKKIKVNTLTPLVEFLINSKSTGIIKNINDDFVNLGLSVLWAKCNIGAKEPEEPGLYFAWGDTIGYKESDKHLFSLETYNKLDVDVLDETHDIATIKYGKNVICQHLNKYRN